MFAGTLMGRHHHRKAKASKSNQSATDQLFKINISPFIKMQFSTVVALLATLTSSALALPAPQPDASAPPTWTIEGFRRQCATDGGPCSYSFAVNTNDGSAATPCSYSVSGSLEDPPARKTYQGLVCGAFTVGSIWSGQFGEDAGFQTLSVVKGQKIVYPAYTDVQLQSGKVVVPDQSYPVQPTL